MFGGTTPSRLFALASFALILASIALLPDRASAASGWQIVLDRPTPNFGAVDFVSDNEGWMIAGGGLLHTTDGGATWTEQAEIDVGDIDMADADHGWAVGRDGTIYGTSDGGETWSRQPSGTFVHLSDVHAISATEAWVTGAQAGYSDVIRYPFPTALLHTTDGGLTWQGTVTPEDAWFYSVTFAGQFGWVAGTHCCPGSGAQRALLHTNDGGISWSLRETTHAGGGMRFFNAEEGWSQGTTALLNTKDGGVSWTAHSRPMSEFLDAVFEDPTTAVALIRDCRNGIDACQLLLSRTTDGAETWTDNVVDGVPITNMRTLRLTTTSSRAYVVGSGVASYTDDDGTSWHDMLHPAITLGSLDRVDDAVGYGSLFGVLYRTDDGGRTWDGFGKLPPNTRTYDFLDPDRGFAATSSSEAGLFRASVYETTDGGKTWSLKFESSSSDYFGMRPEKIQFANRHHGWVFLDAGALVTSDGGRSWAELLQTGSRAFDSVDLAARNNAWAIARHPDRSDWSTDWYQVFQSRGASWTKVLEVQRSLGSPLIDFASSRHGWLVDSVCSPSCRDRILATSDGGVTWKIIQDDWRRVQDIAFVDSRNGWASVAECLGFFEDCQAHIIHTADGGETWATQETGLQFDGDFVFAGQQAAWFVPLAEPGPPFFAPFPQHWLVYDTTDGGGGPIGRLRGDANCNGELESLDAALTLQYSAALLLALPCADAADANGDSSVNAIDAALVLQITAGLTDPL